MDMFDEPDMFSDQETIGEPGESVSTSDPGFSPEAGPGTGTDDPWGTPESRQQIAEHLLDQGYLDHRPDLAGALGQLKPRTKTEWLSALFTPASYLAKGTPIGQALSGLSWVLSGWNAANRLGIDPTDLGALKNLTDTKDLVPLPTGYMDDLPPGELE
jgi:hypothetical protein